MEERDLEWASLKEVDLCSDWLVGLVGLGLVLLLLELEDGLELLVAGRREDDWGVCGVI